MKNEFGYYCDLCNSHITKYKMDLKCYELITYDNGTKFICDSCAKKIAIYVVEEF